MNIQCFINMLCKYNKKELEDKLHSSGAIGG